jgi:hypothetical protein
MMSDALTQEDRDWNVRCILDAWGSGTAAEDRRAEREREERAEQYAARHWSVGMTVAQRFAQQIIIGRVVDARAERERQRKFAEAGDSFTAPWESDASRSARLDAEDRAAFERACALQNRLAGMTYSGRSAYLAELNQARLDAQGDRRR